MRARAIRSPRRWLGLHCIPYPRLPQNRRLGFSAARRLLRPARHGVERTIRPRTTTRQPATSLRIRGDRWVQAQLTAFFTSAAILASSAAVNSVSAKAVGHMAPSSRFAATSKPKVAYRDLNLAAAWKKQTILPSLA